MHPLRGEHPFATLFAKYVSAIPYLTNCSKNNEGTLSKHHKEQACLPIS